MSKLRELAQEFRSVFAGRGNLADSALLPLAFLILNPIIGFVPASAVVLGAWAILFVYRLGKRQPLKNAWGGLLGVLLAMLASRLWNQSGAFVAQGMFSGALTFIACAVSLLVRRPLVAWTSHLARRWPLGWYWHPRVRPAYSEVTLAWMLFYALKLGIQLLLLQETRAPVLVTASAFLGWPATILLLVFSYVYGLWRLGHLRGPSVAEYTSGADPPWEGQRRGF